MSASPGRGGDGSDRSPSNRFTLGRIPIDPASRGEALEAIARLVRSGEGGVVFTPNVDHVVLAEEDPRFAAAYATSSLSLVDGMPVLWACRLLGCRAPEKVSGSDLLLPLLERGSAEGWRVFLLGGRAGVGEKAAALLEKEFPGLVTAGVDGRRVDLEASADSRAGLLDVIAGSRPDLVLIALGSPKGELWAAEARRALQPAVLISVGAALDFLTGAQKRAPPWMSRHGLEWLFRLGSEPRRLWRRYLLRGPKFLPVVARCLQERLRRGSGP